MTDTTWDNGGAPPRKQGTPVWVKVLLGCGVTLLVVLGGCVGLASWGCNAMTRSMEAHEWGQLRQAVTQLQSDEGARALYQANPGLIAAYPSEEAFLTAAAGWRPRLEPLPPHMPSVLSGHISYNVQVNGGFRKTELGYTNGKGAVLASRWENGHLTALELR